jgi:hypothetical protein
MIMNRYDVREARGTLGKMWKRNGVPLTAQELVRALGLSEKHGTDHIYSMESGRSAVSGPIAMLLRIYLAGGVPPDEVVIFAPPKTRKRAA